MNKETLLITGASGFIGKNIWIELSKRFDVLTLGNVGTEDYICDLTMERPEFSEPIDYVFHAAGKAHSTHKSFEQEQEFFKVNVQGTKNLCSSLAKNGLPKSFIFLSTVAVYGVETGEDIDETNPLEGSSPYAQSKIQAEEFLIEWCNNNNVVLTILRPSLVAGPNPPGNLGAMINSINKGHYLSIGNGSTRKSILMVNDLARLIPLVINKGGIYNVCDTISPTFKELEMLISKQLGKKLPMSIPSFAALLLAKIGDLVGDKSPINSNKLSKITESLTFSNQKARTELGWVPLSVLDNFRIND